jgi:hypothetical protein
MTVLSRSSCFSPPPLPPSYTTWFAGEIGRQRNDTGFNMVFEELVWFLNKNEKKNYYNYNF